MKISDEGKKFLAIGLIVGVVGALVFMSLDKRYKTKNECRLKELQKGATPDSSYRGYVNRYCNEMSKD